MFISPAYAQAASGAPQTNALAAQAIPFVLLIVIFYVLVIRPQQKRMREHRELIASVKRNDTVVTGGGFVGKVVKVTDTEAEVELAKGVVVTVIKSTITEVRGRPAPVPANDAKA